MSMHVIEDYIEEAVRAVSHSDMPVSQKRNMIFSLFRLEEYGDCGFTNLRTLPEMVACQYTFVFDKTRMFDYEARREYYDALCDQGGSSQGDPYTPFIRNPLTGDWTPLPDKVCVDSGSETWRGMVAVGAITGEGAKPVERLDDLEVLRKTKKLLGRLNAYLMQAHGVLFLLSGAIDRLPEEEFPEHFGMTKQTFEDEYGD